MAEDVLRQKDSRAGMGAKNAKSPLFLSLLAVEGRAGSQQPLRLHSCVPWARKHPLSESRLKRESGTWVRGLVTVILGRAGWVGSTSLRTFPGTSVIEAVLFVCLFLILRLYWKDSDANIFLNKQTNKLNKTILCV